MQATGAVVCACDSVQCVQSEVSVSSDLISRTATEVASRCILACVSRCVSYGVTDALEHLGGDISCLLIAAGDADRVDTKETGQTTTQHKESQNGMGPGVERKQKLWQSIVRCFVL